MFNRLEINKKLYSPCSFIRANQLNSYFGHRSIGMHTKTIFVLYLIFVLGCSGRPKAPLPQKSTPKSVSPEVMMGPPSLLALTEGTIDNQTSSSDEEEKGPRLSLIKKSRSKAIIQLWFKAGVLNEMPTFILWT